MKTALLISLAASALVGCASAPPSGPTLHSTATSLAAERSLTFQMARLESMDARLDGRSADATFRSLQASALAGDRDAMVELAQIFGRGANGVERDERMMVQWLRRASALNHPAASYQLYLHYLNRGLDRDAVRYENLAVRQGYVLPPRLDPRRG
jgi:TPR repeat protein